MLRWLLSAALLVALPVADLHAADLTGTLKQIQKTGKIRIGYREAQPPCRPSARTAPPSGTLSICAGESPTRRRRRSAARSVSSMSP